jgi:hypothetical protein
MSAERNVILGSPPLRRTRVGVKTPTHHIDIGKNYISRNSYEMRLRGHRPFDSPAPQGVSDGRAGIEGNTLVIIQPRPEVLVLIPTGEFERATLVETKAGSRPLTWASRRRRENNVITVAGTDIGGHGAISPHHLC